MSSWGNLDNVLITGNVSSNTSRDYIDGYQTQFLLDIKDGDYLIFGGNKYQVQNVVSNTIVYITGLAATTSSNVDAWVQQGPKYVANVAFPANNVSIQNIYGIDRDEVDVPENKARGLSHTGWTHYTTYTDAYSQTRNKAEVLVAMSKNFASNATGELFADAGSSDASDDDVAADYFLYFTTQPSDTSNSAGNSAVFTSVAVSDPTGASITYQWYEDNTAGVTTLTDGGVYSGTDTAELTISDVDGLDGFSYYVTISTTGGADSNTSDTAELTVS